MDAQVVIGAVGDTHQLVPLLFLILPLRKVAIQNVNRPLSVMSKLILALLVELEVLSRDAERADPLLKVLDPRLMKTCRILRPAEILHLHLLKFARAKDEIAGRHLIAKGLADLSYAERKLTS